MRALSSTPDIRAHRPREPDSGGIHAICRSGPVGASVAREAGGDGGDGGDGGGG